MALRTSIGTGNWSVAGTWDTGVPVNGDTVLIAAGHTVTFDVDHSALGIDLAGLTINGILQASTSAGNYYLKNSADINFGANGKLNAGSSGTAYPSTCTFTIDFDSTANSMECSTNTGNVNLYCTEPTYKVIKLSGAEAAGQTELSVDTDVTADIWADGDTIRIDDISGTAESEERTIAAGGISADHIDVIVGLTGAKNQDALVVLISRNVRIIGSTNYAIKDGSSCVVGAEISGCTYGVYQGSSHNISGTMNDLDYGVAYGSDHNISSMMSGCTYGVRYGSGHNISGTISGCAYGVIYGSGHLISGTISGCTYGVYQGSALGISGTISGCTYGINSCSGYIMVDAEVSGCTYGLYHGSNMIVTGTLNNTTNIYNIPQAICYNVTFDGVENSGYNTEYCPRFSYVESHNHDGVANAFKAWCRGGIVTSQTVSPPTGHTIWYEFAAEDTTQTYPVFRQYETTVLPGQSIEVTGKIRIADGEDLTGYEPRLQIIDKFADPLVDSTQTALDEDLIPVADGSVATWQDVSVIWANQGDAPRQVIVRMICWNDGGVDTVDVDGVWAVATYQDQIASIYNKLPTNYIMGSSDQTDKDDEIDAIKAKTDNLPASPAAVGSAMTLADDAITSAKYDETTAFPVTSADSGDTEIARTGADGDTLETLSDEVDAVAAKTTNLPASPAAVGSAMTLADDAITAAKFDETTAYPVTAADSAATKIARTGADGDTLETLSDQIDAIPAATLAADTIIDDTATVQDVLQCLLAFMGGKASVVDNGPTRTITYFRRDGATEKLRIVASETDGSRSDSGELDP